MVHNDIQPMKQLHRIMPKHDEVANPNSTEACLQCHRDGAKYIMENAMQKVKAKCQNATECHVMKICGHMAQHPDVVMGMMFEIVRPMALTTAFCAGKGTCDLPDDAALTEIEMGSQPHGILLDSYDKMDWHTVLDEVEGIAPDVLKDREEEEQPDEHCKAPRHVNPRCMKHAMGHVMMHVVGKVKEMCKNTKCEKMQKMCGFAKENRGQAFGMLLGKVEPWKFAMGFCMEGKGHGKGHHRHGHDHKGKGKGHHGHHGHHGEGHHGHHGEWEHGQNGMKEWGHHGHHGEGYGEGHHGGHHDHHGKDYGHHEDYDYAEDQTAKVTVV